METPRNYLNTNPNHNFFNPTNNTTDTNGYTNCNPNALTYAVFQPFTGGKQNSFTNTITYATSYINANT